MADAPGSDPHTLRAFDTELAALDDTLAAMGHGVGRQLDATLDALARRDPGAASTIAGADAEVDDLEQRVNEQVIRLLALRQPKAGDLRHIVSGLRCATMLERAGDYVVGAARRGLAGPGTPPGRSGASVTRMGREVGTLLRQAMAAYLDGNRTAAEAVWHADAEIDNLHASLFRELLTYMMEDPRDIGVCSHMLFVAKNLERIGDQATNIAELAIYRETGETLGHTRPKHDTASFTAAEPADAPPPDPAV